MRRLLDGQPAADAQSQSNATEPLPAATAIDGGEDAYLNSSLVVILAALLFTLIFVLGLNSVVRCAIRCCGRRRNAEAEEEEEQQEGAAAAGINKREALRQIPIVVYGGAAAAAVVTATDCAICLGEFDTGEKVRVLPECRHGFHVKCIDTWLALQSSCPTCRRAVPVLFDNKGGPSSSSSVVVVGSTSFPAARQLMVAAELARGG